MKQKYIAWNVGLATTVHVSVEALIDDWEGFRILLRDQDSGGMIRIAFDSHVAYLHRDESDLEGEACRSEGLGKGSFYTVQRSELLARFQSETVRQFNELTHYAIITDSDCIDVLASEPPTVERL